MNGVALIDEAFGKQGTPVPPFQGEASMMLNRILHRGELKRASFLTTNLEAELSKDIKVLVPMGTAAMDAVIEGIGGIKNAHGTIHWSDRWGRWVVPTVHPSAVLRDGGKELPTVLFDIQRALHLVGGTTFSRRPVDYILYPTTEEFSRWIGDYELYAAKCPSAILACDIETNYSSRIDEEDAVEKDESYEIVRIGFSYLPYTAITLPFTGGHRALAMRLLATNGAKCFWNGNKFDVPRLRQAGMQVSGALIDGMDAWHVYKSDLPKGLGYVSPFFTDLAPWKHLSGTNEEFYNATDADATIRIIYRLRELMMAEGTWETFLKYWVRLEPRLEAMSAIGIGIDLEMLNKRKKEYEDIRDNVESMIQPLIPEVIKPRVKEKERGYKGIPKDVRAYIKQHGLTKECYGTAWTALGYQQFEYPGEDGIGQETVLRWDKIKPFNYNSPDQIVDYITHTYGVDEVPRHPKTGNPTTGKEELERLARKKDDQVLNLILDASNADGKITSFIKPWTPGEDARVHGVFTNTPSTFRLASQSPNLQNFPRRDEEALALRQMIIPGDGWEWLVEADYKSIEAILVGWYAKDPDYMRLAYMGVHAFFAGVKLGLDLKVTMSDSDLKAGIKEAKKLAAKTLVPGSTRSMYDACKQTVHGSNYLEGARLLCMTYPELFPKIKIAEEYQEAYFGTFPKIVEWQQAEVDYCQEHCHVVNAWGLKRWLYAAKKWQYSERLGKWELVNGDDAKKAIATNPQGSAGMIIRGAKLSPAVAELIEEKSLMLTVHDSLVARARDTKHREWVMAKLREAMEYPVEQMDNIVIPVEFKIGRNWGQMEEV